MMMPFFLATLSDPERVKFARFKIVPAGELRRRGISLRVLKRGVRSLLAGRTHPESSLLVGGLVVIAGEMVQRQLVKRVLTRGVFGVPVCPKKPREFLFELISPKLKGKEKIKMMRMLEAMIDEALREFKVQAGLPEVSPQAFCYVLSDEVIEAAKTDACREYLGINARSCPHILSGDMPHFMEIFASKFPDEVETVSQALQASRSRDHLAAISVTGDGENLSVTLVNTAGCRVTMKARRFVQMMVTPGEPVQLGEFPDPRRYREPEVIFNNLREGVVHAQFSVNHGCIEVICVDPNKTGINALNDRSSIAIDVDYALVVALVLNRLHSDEERVSRLLQKLSTKAVDETHRQLFTLK
jgi:hypothetical protein